VSLWSADLGNLETAVRRLSPWADSFHLDAADGHFVPSLLFFPDLIRAIRPHTVVPFHVHLMAEYPSLLAGEFLDAGADLLTVHAENGEREAGAAIEQALRRGCGAGVALKLETPVRAVLPYLDAVEVMILLGTEVGVKGRGLAPQACDRLREARGSAAGACQAPSAFGGRWRHPRAYRPRTVRGRRGRHRAGLTGLPIRGPAVYVSLAPQSLGPDRRT
jgi:ribulose-phosphate 3-epimerase